MTFMRPSAPSPAGLDQRQGTVGRDERDADHHDGQDAGQGLDHGSSSDAGGPSRKREQPPSDKDTNQTNRRFAPVADPIEVAAEPIRRHLDAWNRPGRGGSAHTWTAVEVAENLRTGALGGSGGGAWAFWFQSDAIYVAPPDAAYPRKGRPGTIRVSYADAIRRVTSPQGTLGL